MMDTSYLEKQVSTIINKLHELFDEIGVPSHERDSRESELFAALSDTLHNQLKIVTNEKHALAQEAEKLITSIKQMQISLEGKGASDHSDADIAISYPLQACLQHLKQQHQTVLKIHRERYEQVKKLALAIDSYSSHLEPSFMKIALPPLDSANSCPPTFDLSHAYFEKLDTEFTRVYDEYMRRLNAVKIISGEVINLWAELGTPQAQTDSRIVQLSRDAPEQLGLQAEDLSELKGRRDRLIDEKKNREKRLADMGSQIEQLWERLCIPEQERRTFLASNRGCGMRILNEYEDELGRLNELKKQNLGLFVEETRIQLQNLWDELYFSEEEMLMFTPAFSDVYSDALLAAHESEIERLQCLKEQRLPVLQLVEKHKSLISDREQLSASSQDASRLMMKGQKGEKRDPTRLLREEKMRKRIAKELPKVEAELQKVLESYEQEYGRPFLILGEDYLEEIATAQARVPPPRSKTPSGHSRSQSQTQAKAAPPVKAATMRGAPQSATRSKTPNNFATMRNNPLSQTTTQKPGHTATKPTSPSRIPARPPLSSTHGNRSPERHHQTMGAKPKVMGPPRLPPPKMQDLFVPPQQSTPTPCSRAPIVLERSASIVRQTQPEDPYDDGSHSRGPQYSRNGYYAASNSTSTRSYASSASSSVENHLPHDATSVYSISSCGTQDRNYAHAPPPASRPQSRQISQQSIASAASSANGASVASASENWETFDEGASEDDATHAYYAKLQTQQVQQGRYPQPATMAQKRMAPPEGSWQDDLVGKRVRNGHEQAY